MGYPVYRFSHSGLSPPGVSPVEVGLVVTKFAVPTCRADQASRLLPSLPQLPTLFC